MEVYVSRLRKLLGKDRVQTKVPGYLLPVEEGEVETRFQRLTEQGALAEALALWPPLGELLVARD